MTRTCDCETACRLWLLSSDRRLGPWTRRRVARHLETCPECRAFVADTLMLQRQFTQWLTPRVPEALVLRLRIEAERAANDGRKKDGGRIWLPIPAAAAAFLFLVLG